MKIYTVYTKSNAPLEDAIFVPEEFSFWGFFFPLNIFWAINRRCWLFLAISAILFFIYVLQLTNPNELSTYINLTKLPIQLFLGLFANDFWRASLTSRGYEQSSIVAGKNETEALRNHLINNA